jgi:L-lactate dehydrogenase complex protein LldG
MIDSRSRILASIRKSLASARHLPLTPSVTFPSPSPAPGHPSLVNQFASELQTLNGILIAETADEIPARVLQLLRERNADAVLAWNAAHLPVPGLLDYLQKEGVRIVDAEVPHGEPNRSQMLAEIEKITVGITGVDAALADTGTLALRSGPGCPRLASLSVQTHVALVMPEQLYASWAVWWDKMPRDAYSAWVSGASHLTLISGPSRTADIEMTLTVGVHGPREVIALYIE